MYGYVWFGSWCVVQSVFLIYLLDTAASSNINSNLMLGRVDHVPRRKYTLCWLVLVTSCCICSFIGLGTGFVSIHCSISLLAEGGARNLGHRPFTYVRPTKTPHKTTETHRNASTAVYSSITAFRTRLYIFFCCWHFLLFHGSIHHS